MSVIDKVSVGGTTYDVQDTAAREMASEAKGALNLVDFAQQNEEQTTTVSGLSVSRKGNRITVNGTCSASAGELARVRLGGAIATVASGKPTATQNAAANGAVLNDNHIYRIVVKLVSGTVTPAQAGSFYVTPYKSGTNSVPTQVSSEYDEYRLRDGITGITGMVLWFSAYGGTAFSNATFETSLIDTTAADYTDYTPGTNTISIEGSDPVIAAIPGMRYVTYAPYVTSLSFTPCANGICSVRFRSGSTATLLTLPNTVKMPDWFDSEHLEANRTYEISIEDGVYGVVTSWA